MRRTLILVVPFLLLSSSVCFGQSQAKKPPAVTTCHAYRLYLKGSGLTVEGPDCDHEWEAGGGATDVVGRKDQPVLLVGPGDPGTCGIGLEPFRREGYRETSLPGLTLGRGKTIWLVSVKGTQVDYIGCLDTPARAFSIQYPGELTEPVVRMIGNIEAAIYDSVYIGPDGSVWADYNRQPETIELPVARLKWEAPAERSCYKWVVTYDGGAEVVRCYDGTAKLLESARIASLATGRTCKDEVKSWPGEIRASRAGTPDRLPPHTSSEWFYGMKGLIGCVQGRQAAFRIDVTDTSSYLLPPIIGAMNSAGPGGAAAVAPAGRTLDLPTTKITARVPAASSQLPWTVSVDKGTDVIEVTDGQSAEKGRVAVVPVPPKSCADANMVFEALVDGGQARIVPQPQFLPNYARGTWYSKLSDGSLVGCVENSRASYVVSIAKPNPKLVFPLVRLMIDDLFWADVASGATPPR